MLAPLYLDHNATTPMRPEAVAAMHQWLGVSANPSSVHQFGRSAKAAIETARHQIAQDLGASASGIIFTSGGSEACNHAIQAWETGDLSGAGSSQRPFERIYVSAIEHDAVRQAAAKMACPVIEISVTASGKIDCQQLEALLRAHGPGLICTMLANNETGVIQPLAEIVTLAREHEALVFCDATQAVGKMPVSFIGLGVDMMAVSAHKFGGPVGVGALVIRPALPLPAFIAGGGQELRRRGGTENVAGICAMATALNMASQADLAPMAAARRTLEDELTQRFAEISIFGADEERLPNTICFSVSGLRAETIIMALDLAGIAVSSGSACSSGKVAQSHVLAAMSVDPEIALGAIRVSFGWNSDFAHDGERFLNAFTQAFNRQMKTESKEKLA